jgi:hypothetical protein
MRKRKEFKITSDQVNQAVEEFLSGGGEIKRITKSDISNYSKVTSKETWNFLAPYEQSLSRGLCKISGTDLRSLY